MPFFDGREDPRERNADPEAATPVISPMAPAMAGDHEQALTAAGDGSMSKPSSAMMSRIPIRIAFAAAVLLVGLVSVTVLSVQRYRRPDDDTRQQPSLSEPSLRIAPSTETGHARAKSTITDTGHPQSSRVPPGLGHGVQRVQKAVVAPAAPPIFERAQKRSTTPGPEKIDAQASYSTTSSGTSSTSSSVQQPTPLPSQADSPLPNVAASGFGGNRQYVAPPARVEAP